MIFSRLSEMEKSLYTNSFYFMVTYLKIVHPQRKASFFIIKLLAINFFIDTYKSFKTSTVIPVTHHQLIFTSYLIPKQDPNKIVLIFRYKRGFS